MKIAWQDLSKLPINLSILESMGVFFRQKIAYLGGLSLLFIRFVREAIKRPFFTPELKEQCIQVGVLRGQQRKPPCLQLVNRYPRQESSSILLR